MNNRDFKFTIEPWRTTHEELKYTTNIFKLLSRDMRLESEDHEVSFSIIEAPDWMNIIPLTNNNEVVLVEQYRYGIEEPTLELPGGMVDPGETPEETAKRELLEETGYDVTELISLGSVSSNPAFLTNQTHMYLAKGCRKIQEQELDGNERINVHLMPMDEFLELVKSGTVHHSLVVAAVAKYLLWNS
ncbi:NUDIX hydrolase [Gracilimonas mengyeensis]|uniref:GDP-mannose pyrophosphatase n=1 Tax=Gracilimonas mengyeensis TaxID=1302730 RepID=A0A521DCJ9_9BACT|nr:NUDIX hydrolase [Gracilimonas mengyeensis]SMO69335.1 NUDIX domain-containing protein [Gracilimonas mengyeensis]